MAPAARKTKADEAPAEAPEQEFEQEEVVEGEIIDEGDVPDEAADDPQAAPHAPSEREEEREPEEPEELSAVEIADEVGKALALRDQAVTPTSALPTPAEYNVLGLLANRTYNTTFVPVSYRGREADVFAAFLFGREIGLGPMMALRDVHMIDGRPALAAHRQLAKLRQGGIVILESESTAERAWIKARRSDTGEVMAVEFTMEEALKIVDKKGQHLVDKVNWRSYPSDMLWARCVGRLTRRLGPDLAGGLPPYVAEEVADFSEWGVEYGEAGPTFQEPRREPPAYRKEFPDFNWPKSMAEIRDRLGMILGPDEALEWLRQARESLLPGVAPDEATKDQKDLLFQALSSVLAELSGPDGPDQFEPGVRAKVQAAFAKRFDGAMLDGPAWSLGPDEAETRPQKEPPPEESESAEDAPLEGDPLAGSYFDYAEDDEIPFGSPDSGTP